MFLDDDLFFKLALASVAFLALVFGVSALFEGCFKNDN